MVGWDNRVAVSDLALPYSPIGVVDTGCTGTLIGPRSVLTAGGACRLAGRLLAAVGGCQVGSHWAAARSGSAGPAASLA